jgi:tRNA G18 (ribose-2'-O)-methylase SpoU
VIIEISRIDSPELAVFASLTEAQLRGQGSDGLFIAESPKVINSALAAGYCPQALLCERRHIQGDAAAIIAANPQMPVYTGHREMLTALTGYKLTRGVLCAMKRRALPSVEEICRGARRLAVIDSVTDTTNIGAIFRSAAALGVDGVLLTPTTCDPLNRRAVRVSMGTVFNVPWTWVPDGYATLHSCGFTVAALALSDDSWSLADPRLQQIERLALVLGTEGDGLSPRAISEADLVVRIPMAHGVDSLNVAAASAVAFWQLRLP